MLSTNFILIIVFFLAIAVFIVIKLKSFASSSNAVAEMKDFEVLEIQLAKNEEDDEKNVLGASMAMENLLGALHGLLKEDSSSQEHISFEVASSGTTGIRFYVVVPTSILKFVESQVYAQYPNAKIRVVEDYALSLKHDSPDDSLFYEVSEVELSRPFFFPIKSFRDFEVDPLSSFTSALATIHPSDEVWMQLIIQPVADTWQKQGFDYTKSVREGTSSAQPSIFSGVMDIVKKEVGEILSNMVTGLFTVPQSKYDTRGKPDSKPQAPRLSATQELELRTIENKLSRMGFMVTIRILSASANSSNVETNTRSLIASLRQFSSPTQNSFTSSIEKDRTKAYEEFRQRYLSSNHSMILNNEEITTIYHFPSSAIETPNISWTFSKSAEPPADLPTDDCIYLGETVYRNKKVMFGIKNSNDDRLRHMYMIGKSGTGKSTLLTSMICQDIVNGAGVAVLDPHGETIEAILERIPQNRVQDVVYFDPSDTERPIGLNLLEMQSQAQKNLMASALVSAIKQHFDYSWGPRLEYLLNYSLLTLLEVPGTSMLGITRLLEDQNYQRYILHQVKDPVVLKFWESEFKEMKGNQKLVTEAISPIQNKVNRFLASTTIRNILGQRTSTLDMWDIMNNGKILLINLSKGKIGSDNANLLGALLVSRLQFFALQRANIPYDQRKPFYLYVDEFQNFATGSFEEILSESRKYKLGLYLTHQFTAQLPEPLLKAVFGNVGTILSFSLGAPDARELEREFAPYFTFEDVLSLERFQIYIKLMLNGMTSHPFSARILVPWIDEFLNKRIPKTGLRDEVIRVSREKFGVPREYIEEKINRWVTTKFDKGMAIAQEYKGTPNGVNNINSENRNLEK